MFIGKKKMPKYFLFYYSFLFFCVSIVASNSTGANEVATARDSLTAPVDKRAENNPKTLIIAPERPLEHVGTVATEIAKADGKMNFDVASSGPSKQRDKKSLEVEYVAEENKDDSMAITTENNRGSEKMVAKSLDPKHTDEKYKKTVAEASDVTTERETKSAEIKATKHPKEKEKKREETRSIAAMPKAKEREKKSLDEGAFNNDNGFGIEETKDDTMEIPSENPNTIESTASTTPKVPCARRLNSKVHGIQSVAPSQFTFMAALLNQRYEYVCAGTVVASNMILTSAKCINSSVFYALLNSISDKKDNRSTIVRIEKSETFPTFASGDNNRDVGIAYLENNTAIGVSKVKLANISDFNQVVDMEAFGYGLNADTGVVKQLQHIGLEHRKLYDAAELKRGFFDCVDTMNKTCFKDFGGPVLANDQLIGVVVRGQPDCLLEVSSKYALNKLMAEVLPSYVFRAWFDERLKKHVKEDNLPVFPSSNSTRRSLKIARKSSATHVLALPPLAIIILSLVFLL